MANDSENDAQKNARSFRTNDQLKPKPPEKAQPQPGLSPLGTVGTHSRLSKEDLRRNNEIYRKTAEEKERNEERRQRGGLRKDFDQER